MPLLHNTDLYFKILVLGVTDALSFGYISLKQIKMGIPSGLKHMYYVVPYFKNILLPMTNYSNNSKT